MGKSLPPPSSTLPAVNWNEEIPSLCAATLERSPIYKYFISPPISSPMFPWWLQAITWIKLRMISFCCSSIITSPGQTGKGSGSRLPWRCEGMCTNSGHRKPWLLRLDPRELIEGKGKLYPCRAQGGPLGSSWHYFSHFATWEGATSPFSHCCRKTFWHELSYIITKVSYQNAHICLSQFHLLPFKLFLSLANLAVTDRAGGEPLSVHFSYNIFQSC